MRFIGAVLLLGFIVTATVSLAQAFVESVPTALIGAALQGLLAAIAISVVIVVIAFKSASVAESRVTRWVRSVAGPNGRYAFGLLILAWTGFMFVLSVLPPEPNGAPAAALGGLGLVGLMVGTFIFLGFIWSVISE